MNLEDPHHPRARSLGQRVMLTVWCCLGRVVYPILSQTGFLELITSSLPIQLHVYTFIHDCLFLWVSLSLEQFLWRALEGPSLQSGTTDPVLVPWLHSMKLENSQNHTLIGACRGQYLSRVHQPKLVADMKRDDYLEFIELYNYKLFLVMYTTWCNPHLGKMAGKVTLLRIH